MDKKLYRDVPIVILFDNPSHSHNQYFHNSYILAHSIEYHLIVVGRPIPQLTKSEVKINTQLRHRQCIAVNQSNFRNHFYVNNKIETNLPFVGSSKIDNRPYFQRIFPQIIAIINPPPYLRLHPNIVYPNIADYLSSLIDISFNN